ncbi:hypothetical protein GUJ93_ZPchr0001g32488 [Zizania palustris]|uniref:Uncharacterized protein n=1 Tax=Zizania palustris TaxID=103762 RepID=A0A8J5R9X8_ZIZPA|nr:hypothetical protein GUJ93_ZPchr0001g32488 [Zizania palustris]
MLKVLVDSTLDIPRSITIKSCHSMDGEGRSWTFPVYIVSNEIADGLPGDEEDLPPDGGNPHPFDGEVYLGEPAGVQQWVDDQMLQVPFHNAPIPEQEGEAEHFFGEPMVDDMHWDQWPQPQMNMMHVPRVQEELSMEVSGLSIGLNSGSTTISANNSSFLALVQSVEHAMQEAVPLQMPPVSLPRPPIRLFYGRRNRKVDDEKRKGKATSTSANAIASTSKGGKGKEIMPDKPTLQDFLKVSLDNGKQFSALSFGQINHAATHYCGLTAQQATLARLMTDDGITDQLAMANASTAGDASNDINELD